MLGLRVQSPLPPRRAPGRGLRNFRKLAQNPFTSEKGAHKHNKTSELSVALLGNFQSTASVGAAEKIALNTFGLAQSHDDALLCRFIQSRRSSACAHALLSPSCHRLLDEFFMQVSGAGRRESRIRRTHTATAATQFASKG
jgi:hypothetical protein